MAIEKFAVSGSSAGFLSLQGKVTNASTGSGTEHKLNIPTGMIDIGGNGRGFIIPDLSNSNSYDFGVATTLDDGFWIVYAIAPVDDSGIVTINFSLYDDYILIGDTDVRRAFIEFLVQDSVLISESIRVRDNFNYEQIYKDLQKIGFFRNSDSTVEGFDFLGQNIIENVEFDLATPGLEVDNWYLVFKHIDGKFYTALSDDTNKEIVVGLANKGRYGYGDLITYDNFVITSGIVNIGTEILPNDIYPTGTYLYLADELRVITESVLWSNIEREFDHWAPTTDYSFGDVILEDNKLFKNTTIGTNPSQANDIIAWDSVVVFGDLLIDSGAGNPIYWEYIADYSNSYLSQKKNRIGKSLGDGVILLSGGIEASIDDHDESPYAHKFFQLELEKFGIHIPGSGYTEFKYRGQNVLESPVFDVTSNALDEDIVFLSDDDEFEKAQTLITSNIKETGLGIRYDYTNYDNVSYSHVITSGFVGFSTDKIIGIALLSGQKLYISETAGVLTNNPNLIEEKNLFGTLISIGTLKTGLININPQIKDNNYKSFSIENNADINSSVTEDYTIVYNDSENSEYNLALANGEKESKYVGVCLPSQNLIITGGFLDIPETGINASLDALLDSGVMIGGDPIYINVSGEWSNIKSTVRVGQFIESRRILISSTGGGSGDGDINREDTLYMSILSSSAYLNCYYDTLRDIIDIVNFGTGEEPTWNANLETLDGVSGNYIYDTIFSKVIWISENSYELTDKIVTTNWILECTTAGDSAASEPDWDANINSIGDTLVDGTVTWTAVQDDIKEYKLFVHKEELYDTDNITFYYSIEDSPNWTTLDDFVEITDFDSSIEIQTGFYSLHMKAVWTGVSQLDSFGFFYSFTQTSGSTGSHMRSVWEASQNETAPFNLPLPNGNFYTNDDNSLMVWHSAKGMLTVNEDYTETDSRNLEILFDVLDEEKLTFFEMFGFIDSSVENTIRLNHEHNSIGEHILEDTATGTNYQITITNGSIVLVEIT